MTTGIYIRVSSDEQAKKGISLNAQKEKAINYCKENNIKDYKIYEDAGYSGGTSKRPAFQQLQEDLHKKEIKRVIVFKVDRLARDMKILIMFLDEVKFEDVEFISLTEPINTSSAMGRALFQIIGVFAELERGMNEERVFSINEKKIREGKFLGKPPIGYKYNEKKEVIIDEDNAQLVKKVFSMWIKGINYKQIHKETKIPIPTIYDITKNPVYAGYIRYVRKVKDREKNIREISEPVIYKCKFPALIDLKTFKKINPNFKLPEPKKETIETSNL